MSLHKQPWQSPCTCGGVSSLELPCCGYLLDRPHGEGKATRLCEEMLRATHSKNGCCQFPNDLRRQGPVSSQLFKPLSLHGQDITEGLIFDIHAQPTSHREEGHWSYVPYMSQRHRLIRNNKWLLFWVTKLGSFCYTVIDNQHKLKAQSLVLKSVHQSINQSLSLSNYHVWSSF